MPSVTEYSLCILRWTKRGAFTKKFYHPMRRELPARAPVERAMRTRLCCLLNLLALVALAPGAQAQGVYKYTTPDGQVIYTDDPNAGSGTARALELPPPPGSKPPAPRLSDAEKKLLEQANQRAAALDRAVADIVAAQDALRVAEARRDAGVEPLEGERQGRRHRPEYWQRQQALERDVVSARKSLDDALARRNALR
jgi:uncharacterized protein DUF4124